MLTSTTIAVGIVLLFATAPVLAAEPLPAGVARLLEDNGPELLPLLTNPGGDLGEGEVEKKLVFAGASAIKITHYQRYFNLLPGWAHRIAETPKEGEYRYLRFAWKADGLTGIMLQLHDEKDWHIRYVAGANKFGWESKSVAETPPQEWTLVTMDLSKDFGAREIHGIALTAFDGQAGYFDHIYLGRTVADLDAIDATGLGAKAPLALTRDEIDSHWRNLACTDDSVAYRSFWTLAAGGNEVRAELEKKLSAMPEKADEVQIRRWLQELDHDDFAVREGASAKLKLHLSAARKLIEDALKRTESLEARVRLELLSAMAERPATNEERSQHKVRRILSIMANRK